MASELTNLLNAVEIALEKRRAVIDDLSLGSNVSTPPPPPLPPNRMTPVCDEVMI